jgi:hypothetical protein
MRSKMGFNTHEIGMKPVKNEDLYKIIRSLTTDSFKIKMCNPGEICQVTNTASFL